jgi:hypothetical protein
LGTADVHLFDIGYPHSGQGIGAHFSAYSFCASKKSKATAGGATPGFGFRFFADRKSLFACTSPSFYKPREYWRDSDLPLIAVVPVAAGSRLTFFAYSEVSSPKTWALKT